MAPPARPDADARRQDAGGDDVSGSRLARRAQDALHVGEDVIYVLVAIVLFAGAALLLVEAVVDLATGAGEGAKAAVEAVLDTLLLIFILVELLGAVRTTLKERALVAEPFLIVGVIATIKETIVVAIRADDLEGAAHDDAMVELAVLAGLLLALAIAMFLSRRKEREPEEAGAG